MNLDYIANNGNTERDARESLAAKKRAIQNLGVGREIVLWEMHADDAGSARVVNYVKGFAEKTGLDLGQNGDTMYKYRIKYGANKTKVIVRRNR